MKKILLYLTPILIYACASNPNKIANQVATIGKPGDVEVVNLTKARDIKTGITTVRFSFKVTEGKPEQVFWRCDYYNAEGVRVGDPERYTEAALYPNQLSEQSCSYPSDQVVDFKINFQNIRTNMILYN